MLHISHQHILIDVDECGTIEDICENGECINNRGSFQCICPSGFELSPDGTKCVDQRQEQCFERYQQGKLFLYKLQKLSE